MGKYDGRILGASTGKNQTRIIQMSISRAQAKALRDGYINSVGAEPPAGELPIIDAVMGMAAKEFIDVAVANLDAAGAVSKGQLAAQLTSLFQIIGTRHILSIGYPKGSEAAVYWDFTNKGVGGVNKPGKAPGSPYKFRYMGVSPRHALALLKWYRHNGKGAANVAKDYPVGNLEKKRVNLRATIKQKDDLSQLAYATGMAMKRDGLKPTHYFDDAVKEVLNDELMDALAVALGGEIILRIRQYGDNL